MIGQHSVSFIPDPDVQSWGAVLNSNPYMTTDIAGWTNSPFTDAWSWGVGGYAVGAVGGSAWLVRSRTAPIPRGTSTLFRARFKFTVAVPGRVSWGLFYGDTATAAEQGPFWAGGAHAQLAEQTTFLNTAGTYTVEITHDPANVPPSFTFVGPQIHWDTGPSPGMNPVVDSVELWGQGADLVDLTCLVDEVTIHHGRDDADSQPDASSATINLSVDTSYEEFPAAVEVGGIIRVVTTTAETSSVRFTGRVTDLTQGWDDEGENTPNAAVAQIIATGTLSELGRRVVGDTPWGQELDGSRISRIMAAAGLTLDPNTSDPGTVQILARDVDSQPALDVAQEVAESAGGLVWETRSGDVRYADADHRRGSTASLILDACDVLVTPTWRRTTEGLVNLVSIGYGVPTTEGGDQPRYTAQRADSIEAFGTYGFTSTTQLAALADAAAMGQLLLTRNRVPVWILSNLPVAVDDLNAADTTALLNLDMHDLLELVQLPAAGNTPTSVYLWVEGWTERLAWGVHDLELVVSGYCRTSPAPRWNDLQASQTWDSMGSITWDDATCLGPLPNRGRWDDVPASTRWNNVPFGVTWDTWPY
jgi:hypothetical protein